MVAIVVALFAGAAAARSPALVIDYETNRVLLAQDAEQPWYPASLAKLMTVYLAFEALSHEEIGPDDKLEVSAHAAAQGGTRLGLAKGASLTVIDAIRATVLRSANDAAVTLAEGLAPSEDVFAERMTERARRLGMTATVFRNASGLPDSRQWTTAGSRPASRAAPATTSSPRRSSRGAA